MYQLSLPDFNYQIKRKEQAYYIFDIIRKRYVRLTPEEWTRQHFVHYLINQLAYPKTLLSIEKGINYNERQHRPDIVVYSKTGKACMIIECKAPYVPIADKAYSQLARYNRHLQAKVLIVTNGKQHGCWGLNEATLTHDFLHAIPAFGMLV